MKEGADALERERLERLVEKEKALKEEKTKVKKRFREEKERLEVEL